MLADRQQSVISPDLCVEAVPFTMRDGEELLRLMVYPGSGAHVGVMLKLSDSEITKLIDFLTSARGLIRR